MGSWWHQKLRYLLPTSTLESVTYIKVDTSSFSGIVGIHLTNKVCKEDNIDNIFVSIMRNYADDGQVVFLR